MTKSSIGKMKKATIAKFWLVVENGNPSPNKFTRGRCTRHPNTRCTRGKDHAGWCTNQEKRKKIILKKVKRYLRSNTQVCTKRRDHDEDCITLPSLGCPRDPRCQKPEIPHDGQCQIDKKRLVATTKEHQLINGEYHIFMGKVLKKRKRGDTVKFVMSWEKSKDTITGKEYLVHPSDKREVVDRPSIMPHN